MDAAKHFEFMLGLYLIPGVGPATYFKIIQNFSTPEDYLKKQPGDLQSLLPRATAAQIQHLLQGPHLSQADKVILHCKNLGVQIIPFGTPLYPKLLGEISNPPPFLWILGNWPPPRPCVAVVGTRNPSDYGIQATRKMAQGLVESGYTIVSGAALGVDSLAHVTALKNKVHTVAVLGQGVSTLKYSRGSLLHSLRNTGAIVTEYSPLYPPSRFTFPLRNRIISGLCEGTLIVESGQKSGANITAQYARRQGRKIFAVPGSIYNPKSEGTNLLIRQGATLVTQAKHITSQFLPAASPKTTHRPARARSESPSPILPAQKISPQEKFILQTLSQERTLEELTQISSGMGTPLLSILLTLEAKGLVIRKPGSVYTQV